MLCILICCLYLCSVDLMILIGFTCKVLLASSCTVSSPSQRARSRKIVNRRGNGGQLDLSFPGQREGGRHAHWALRLGLAGKS